MRNQGLVPGKGRTFIHSNYTSSRAQKVTYPSVMRGFFCEHEVYCSPPCNITVTIIWSPAFTRCYPKVPEIGMPHKNCLLYSCVLLSISAKWRSAVRRWVFLPCILWHVIAMLRWYRHAKMSDVKGQRICIKFCFKLGKMASETRNA